MAGPAPRLDPTRRLALSRHAELKTRFHGDVLVLPERAIRLGGSGAEILRLCGGGRSADAIVAALRERYPERPELEREVLGFLARMLDLGGLVEPEAAPGDGGKG